MKFVMEKGHLIDALAKIKEVSTKGIKSDFEVAHRATIDVSDKKATFYGSNGHLDAKCEVTASSDGKFECSETGTVTLAVSVFLGICRSLGSSQRDHIFEMKEQDGTLILTDKSSKTKKKIKAQLLPNHLHEETWFGISKPNKPQLSVTMPCEIFRRAVTKLRSFQSKMGYKIRYQMLCMHFLPEEVRFICGDGMRFAVLTQKNMRTGVKKDGGERFLIPVDQAGIISTLLENAEQVDFDFFNGGKSCYIKPHCEAEMCLKGIPAEDYIAYENHAYKSDDAKFIIDIAKGDLLEAAAVVGSVQDPDLASDGGFHSFKMVATSDGDIEFLVDEGKYQCEFDCPRDFYPLNDSKTFRSAYAWLYLNDLAHITDASHVRFFCADGRDTLIAKPVDINDTDKDERGVPMVKNDDDCDLLMFFAAVLEDEDDE